MSSISRKLFAAVAVLAVCAAATIPSLPLKWSITVPGMGAAIGVGASQDGTKLFAADQDHIFGVDVRSQAVLWKFELGLLTYDSSVVNVQTVAGLDAVFFGGSDNAGIVALNGSTGQILWVNTTYNTLAGAPTLSGKILAVTATYSLVALDPLTGDALWGVPTGTSGLVSFAVSPNQQYGVFLANEQTVTVLDLNTGKVVYSSTVAATSLYAVSNTHVLFSYDTFTYGYNPQGQYYEDELYRALAVEFMTGKVVSNISCGFYDEYTGSTSAANSNGQCNGAALFPATNSSGERVALIVGNGSVLVTELSPAVNAGVLRQVYSFGSDFRYQSNSISLTAVPQANALVALVGSYDQTNLTLISTTSMTAVTIPSIPSGPNGANAQPFGSKCVLTTNVQGIILFNAATGAIVARDEDLPDVTKVITIGSDTVLLPSAGSIGAYSLGVCQ